MMTNFDKAYLMLTQNEGGYANNKMDKGGETYRGISRRFHQNWRGWLLIDKMKQDFDMSSRDGYSKFVLAVNGSRELQDLTKCFFKTNYWDINQLSKIENIELAKILFDVGVNSGVRVAGKHLQRALNYLGSDLKVDGIIGFKTIDAFKSFKKKEHRYIIEIVRSLQITRYVEITENDSNQKYWSRIWLRRMM